MAQLKIDKIKFLEMVLDDIRKGKKVELTHKQIVDMIPELESMYDMHDRFMKGTPPKQIMTGAFVAGALFAAGGFKNEEADLIITRQGNNHTVDYIHSDNK